MSSLRVRPLIAGLITGFFCVTAISDVITDQVDSKNGEKYQELQAEFTVKYFNEYKQSSNNTIIRVNDYAVTITTISELPFHGRISLPFHVNQNEFNKYIGLKGRLYCRMKDVEIVRKSCRLCGESKVTIDKYCSLYGKDEYYLVIE